MTIKMPSQSVCLQLAEALGGGNAEQQAAAFAAFSEDIASQIRADIPVIQQGMDARTLESRGYRQLTSAETSFYQKLTDALKSANPKQSFIDLLGHDDVDDIMPMTIFDDVIKYIKEQHPLLNKIRFVNAGYSTKWIINDNTTQMGAWGDIDDEITKEIKGGLKVIDLTQSKYTAFCIVPRDFLDMGPLFMDAFVRATMAEALALGMEEAIIDGSGVKMPTGMMRNPNGSYDQSTGYPAKTAVEVTSFSPLDYGALVAKVAVTEKGKTRTFQKVAILCNMVDYLAKVMPATTALAMNGAGYVNNLFPFPTEVIPVSCMDTGKAVLGVLEDYTLAVGGKRNGVLEYDDSYKFLEDARTFKIIQHAAGRAYDNNSFIVLDISELDPAYLNVKVANADAFQTTSGSDTGQDLEV